LALRVKGIGVCSGSLGMGWENFKAPNSGLLGVPVGMSAKALRENGLSPFLRASAPVAVKMPHLMNSRRLTWPCDRALTISARLSLARCASRCRMRDAFCEMYLAEFPLAAVEPYPS
jgi:hypothetical protein